MSLDTTQAGAAGCTGLTKRPRAAGPAWAALARGAVRRSGLTSQYAAVDDALTGSENLVMVGRLLDLGRADARRRAEELLERFDLAEAGHRPVKTYSGGMRRRLDLALSMVGRPQVLFLDEPPTHGRHDQRSAA